MTTTSSATYSPGAWVAASSESAWLLVDLGLDDPRLADCWSGLAVDADRVIDVLLSRGLGGLPGFALVVARASTTRIVARHPALVTCRRGGEEPTVVTGAVGRTWTDVELSGEYDEISLSSGDNAPLAIRLPLAQGITPAGVLIVSAAREPASATSAAVDHEGTVSSLSDAQDVPEPKPTIAEPEPVSMPDLAVDPKEESAADTGTSYYGRLLGATVDRDALLAELAESQADDEEQPPPAATPHEPETSRHTAIWQPEGPAPDTYDPAEATESTAEPQAPATDSARLSSESGAGGGLIDGVPWATGSNGAVAPPPPAEPFVVAPGFAAPTPVGPPPNTPAADVGTSPTTAPPLSATAASTAGAESPETAVRTVNRAELLKSLAAPAHPGPTVLAVRCPRSHLSSAYSAQCRVCGEEVGEQVPTEQPRPALGQLVLSTGEIVILDRDVVLGRAPESAEEDPALRPNLVRLTDSDEVSRMHVRVTLDGWQPMIRDLGSSNGTTLTLSSSSPQQLRPQEDYALEPGCEVALADVVSFRFEVTG
ncbi:MAG TPA: FHA domain-containing protein [Marmoricola sp.]|nr:FHA domain-containing protein [Marmoricola sp.]